MIIIKFIRQRSCGEWPHSLERERSLSQNGSFWSPDHNSFGVPPQPHPLGQRSYGEIPPPFPFPGYGHNMGAGQNRRWSVGVEQQMEGRGGGRGWGGDSWRRRRYSEGSANWQQYPAHEGWQQFPQNCSGRFDNWQQSQPNMSGRSDDWPVHQPQQRPGKWYVPRHASSDGGSGDWQDQVESPGLWTQPENRRECDQFNSRQKDVEGVVKSRCQAPAGVMAVGFTKQQLDKVAFRKYLLIQIYQSSLSRRS